MFVNDVVNKISFKNDFFFRVNLMNFLYVLVKKNYGDVFYCCVLKVYEKIYDLCFNIRYELMCSKIIFCLINKN